MDIVNFIKSVKQLVAQDKNYETYYRGHANEMYELIPSIYRNGLIENEDNIFKETIVKIPHEFTNCKSTIEKLVKMQHYGVPTRLLDITSNPLVALFFACNNDNNADGEVVFLKIPKTNIKFFDSDTISAIANIAKRPSTFEIDSTITKISEFNDTYHIGFLHHEIKEEKPYYQEIINPKHLEDIFAVKVKLDNHRILIQSGAFLLFGINANKKMQAEVKNSWIIQQLKIPAIDKGDILKELNMLGINKSFLFPEIEHQGNHLIDKYRIA